MENKNGCKWKWPSLVTMSATVKDELIGMLLDGRRMTRREHERDDAGWWWGIPCCLVIGWKSVTCRVGRGRGRVPEGPTLLLSSSRARVRRSNCISCSRTEARRDAAFSHCSIHTERKRTGLHTRAHVVRVSWKQKDTCLLHAVP